MNTNDDPLPSLDFSDTKIAFHNKSDQDLKEMFRLFQLMNNGKLVNMGTSLGRMALRMKLPFVQSIMKRTIFKQFCGGINLMDSQDVIDLLYDNNVLTVLDYGAEAMSKEEDLNNTLEELINSVGFAASNNSVPVVVCKLTALVDNDLMIKKQDGVVFSAYEQELWDKFMERIDSLCKRAHELEVAIFIDAEESWMQEAMDKVVNEMMALYNRDYVTVYNTYQLYRHDKLAQLIQDHKTAQSQDYLLGAKLVRGAYMDKERARAKEMSYPSPIQPDKASTDKDYNAAVLYCLDHYEEIAFCNATHNVDSTKLMAEEIDKRGISRDHRHVNFCQLYGMSDYMTFNLAAAGYNVAKYVVYGPLRDVVEYLIRRAQENTSVTGEMSRELSLIDQEIKRRGLR